MPVSAKPIDVHEPFQSHSEVVDVRWVPEVLDVRVESIGCAVKLQFAHVEAYRVMDERDMLEFWPPCSGKGGLVWEILDGGWLALERSRGTLVALTVPEIREFLVVGINACVSVLAHDPPTLQWEAAAT